MILELTDTHRFYPGAAKKNNFNCLGVNCFSEICSDHGEGKEQGEDRIDIHILESNYVMSNSESFINANASNKKTGIFIHSTPKTPDTEQYQGIWMGNGSDDYFKLLEEFDSPQDMKLFTYITPIVLPETEEEGLRIAKQLAIR